MDRLWLVRDGTVTVFDGDLEEYRDMIVGAASRPKPAKVAANSDEPRNKGDNRKANAGKRASLSPLKKKIDEAASLMARFEKQIAALDKDLADPLLYERYPLRATKLSRERAEAVAELVKAEELWLELSTEYEEAMAG